MSTPGACPHCGGAQRTTIAPGFYECTTQNLVGIAPGTGPGTPVYQQCGHQYQEGATTLGTLCSCGLGAVGACKRCGKQVCGRHGSSHVSEFLCGTHWHEAEREAAERRTRQTQEAAAARLKADQEYEARVAGLAPGFPTSGAGGSALADALTKLVPGRLQTVVLEQSGRFRVKRATGWLMMERGQQSTEPGYSGVYTVSWHGTFVTPGGKLYDANVASASTHLDLAGLLAGKYPMIRYSKMAPSYRISKYELLRIRRQVITWRAGAPT